MLGSVRPVPWVAVEIAPASVCLSMSPRFSCARPRRARASLRSRRTIPACTFTSSPSASSTRSSAPRCTITPSVSAHSLNEWPLPATFTVRPAAAAPATTSTSSSRLRGLGLLGAACSVWSPAQLLQLTGSSCPRRGRWAARPRSREPSSRYRRSKCSHSSPALTWRKYTWSPEAQARGGGPVQRRLHLARALERRRARGPAAGTGAACGRFRRRPRRDSRRPAPSPSRGPGRRETGIANIAAGCKREGAEAVEQQRARRSPSRRVASVIAGSAATSCRSPVPPAFTSSSSATSRTAAMAAARRSRSSA